MKLTDRFNRWLVQIAADIRDEHERRTKAEDERLKEAARKEAEAELDKKRAKEEAFNKQPFLMKVAQGWSPPACIDLSASKQYEDELDLRDRYRQWKAGEYDTWMCPEADDEMREYDRRQQAQEVLATRMALHGKDASVIAPAVGWTVKEVKEFLKTRRVQ